VEAGSTRFTLIDGEPWVATPPGRGAHP